MSWTISAGGRHPEALDWQTRVIANGGAVSRSTLNVVSDFCVRIDQEPSLRGAITRLNLFCGDNLNAALVPLYLAESSGAAAKGNAVDANNNFISGDYAATGASGGLTATGNPSSAKYLNTGLPQNQVGTSTSSHLSISGSGFTQGDFVPIGSYNGAAANLDDINLGPATISTVYRSGDFDGNGTTFSSSWGHLLGSRTTSTSKILYGQGAALYSNTSSVSLTRSTRPYFVFALNVSGTVGAFTTGRLRMYSIGSGVTAGQAFAFSNAVLAFNAALGR